MVLQKTNDGYIVKKKFTFAFIALVVGTIFASKGVYLSDTVEEIVLALSAYGTFISFLLGIVFTADVADKKFNNGNYHPAQG